MAATLSPRISRKRFPSIIPDVPVTELPLSQDANNDLLDFDTLLDYALNDLRLRLSDAHRRELQRNGGAEMEVSQIDNLETQVNVPQVVVIHPATHQAQPSVCSQNDEPAPVVEGLVAKSTTAKPKTEDSSATHVSGKRSVTAIVKELRDAIFKNNASQMRSALSDHKVMVNRHLLKQRLVLEYNLVAGSWKLLRWLLCFIPLLCCLYIFEPSADIGNVHEMLIEHYGIGHNSLLELKEWDHVYGFFEKFKKQNDLLEPTGKLFWCDPRYLDQLGITAAGATEFKRQRELAGFPSNGQRASSPASFSSSSAPTPSTGSGTLEATLLSLKHVYQNPTPLGTDPHGHDRFLFDCRIPTNRELVDIHHKLEQARAGNNTVGTRRRRTDGYGPLDDYKTYFPNEFNETYQAYINHIYVNQTEPSTGTYLSRYHYPYSAVSLFDPVIYQDRYALHECRKGTFAEYFVNQGWNILSPVFGQSAPKAVDILECVDRRKHVHDEIADDIDTDRFRYMGKDIYARLAGQAGDHTGPEFSDWQRIGWLGKQTETASISVLIYIEGLEMFTSLSVHFTQGAGGSIACQRAIASVVELDDQGTEWMFHLCVVTTCINCLVCLTFDLSNCRRLRLEHRNLDQSYLFEVFARFTMLIFAITLEISYMGRETMSSLFKDAFDTFLYRSDFSHTGQIKALQHFFEVKEHVQATDAKHSNIKIVGSFVYAFQVFQLILLLGAHPRVDLLCSTILKTINGLVHYLLIFFALSLMLGCYAHWMFSSTLPSQFGSLDSAIMKQIEMVVGYADAWPWEEMKLMSSIEFVWFCTYLLTYFGLVFLILLNFFIAIILEGFIGVWKALTEDNVGGSGTWLPIDMWHAWRGACAHRRKGWPSRIDIVTRIKGFEKTQKKWDTFESNKIDTHVLSEMILVDEYGFDDKDAALEFLSTYALRAPLILDLRPKKIKDRGGKPDRAQVMNATYTTINTEYSESQVKTPGSVAELVAAGARVGQQEQLLEDQKRLAEQRLAEIALDGARDNMSV